MTRAAATARQWPAKRKALAGRRLGTRQLNRLWILVIVNVGDHGSLNGPFAFQEEPRGVLILLTNDDGIFAPGLAAIERELRRLGEVYVVAPASEQSGVGHSITYLTPLIVKEIFLDQRRWGWAVEGSPADCVKLGVAEFCPRRPDLVVSGINGGLNVGINVLYSGTVAAAVEGAFFGITSIAVSLEFDEHAPFDKAARLARMIIQQVLRQKTAGPQLYNMNIPAAALRGRPQVQVVPMDVSQYEEQFEKRTDPFGRAYYWLKGQPPPVREGYQTDLSAMAKGFIALTPLDYNMTCQKRLAQMQSWQFCLDDTQPDAEPATDQQLRGPVLNGTQQKQQPAAQSHGPATGPSTKA